MDASTYIDVDAVTAIPANIFYQTSNTPTARGRGRPRKSTAMHGASETKRKRVDDDGQKEIDKKRRVDDKKAVCLLLYLYVLSALTLSRRLTWSVSAGSLGIWP